MIEERQSINKYILVLTKNKQSVTAAELFQRILAALNVNVNVNGTVRQPYEVLNFDVNKNL